MARQGCVACGVLFGLLLLGVATRADGQADQPAPKLLYRIGAAGIGHDSRLDYVEFSADGRFVATAAEFEDNSICVWDLATGIRCFRLKLGNMIGCSGVTLSADGQQVAAFVMDRSIDRQAMIFVWDVASGKERQAVAYGVWKLSRRAALAFSPDGKLLAVGGTDVKLIDLITGEIQTTLLPVSEVHHIAFHKGGRLIATSGKDVQFWDPINGKPRGALGLKNGWEGIFSPDGSCLAYIVEGTTFNLRSITVPADATKPVAFGPVQEIAKFPLAQKRQAFSPDGKKLFLSGNIYECQEFEVATGKLLRTWTRPKEYLFTLGYHGNQPIAVTRRESNDQAMQFWDTANNNELFTGTGHHQSVSSLLFCPNDVLISGSRDIRVWNTRDQTLLAHSNNTDWAVRLMLMPGGKEVASVGRKITWWSLPECKKLREFESKLYPSYYAYGPVLFPDGRAVAVPVVESVPPVKAVPVNGFGNGSPEWKYRGVSIRDVETNKEVRRIPAIDRPYLQLSPDGETIAAGTAYQLKFWDLNRKDQSHLNPSPAGDVAVFSADSKYAAVGDNATITIWEVATQRTIRVIKLPETDFIKGNPRTIRVMAFSPNNRLLAIGTPHGSIKIWDIEAEKNVTVFEAHEIGVSTLVFRPDGRVLASASWDRTIALWDVSTLNTTGKVDFSRKKGEKP